MLTGATPVFVDCDPQTYCLDVSQIEGKITERTKAIIPVHLYGYPADMTPLLKLAEARGLTVIEDNAQAFGAEYEGRKTGSMGTVGCLSFFPSKTLGGYGDGGMVVTNDAAIAERVRMLRMHGWRKKYYPEVIGYNSRLDEIQAAILRVKLHHVDEWNERRREMAQHYNAQLSSFGVGVPHETPNAKHVYHLYMIRVKNRDQVQEALKEAGIASALYYPQPLHLTKPCRALGYTEGDFPVAEQSSAETLAIPVYPEMNSEQVNAVIEALRRVVREPAAMAV